MRTGRTQLLGLAFLLASAPGCVRGPHTRHGDRVDVSGYPAEIQAAYRVFAVHCSRCHTLARPLNAHIRDPHHWVRYLARMRRTPGSGINREDSEVILKFLLFYTQQAEAELAPDAGKAAPSAKGPAPAVAHPLPVLASPEPGAVSPVASDAGSDASVETAAPTAVQEALP